MRLVQEDEPVTSPTTEWGAIVIGSGIGGLACAAALAHYGHPVLMLEQYHVAGGLTHTFTCHGFTFSIGVYYLGDVGPQWAMLGCTSFDAAQCTFAGIERMPMLRKGQVARGTVQHRTPAEQFYALAPSSRKHCDTTVPFLADQ
jgi:phytoene dehydrogenase-like protein